MHAQLICHIFENRCAAKLVGAVKLFHKVWRTEHLVNKAGNPRKRDAKEVAELAEYAAWCSKMLKILHEDSKIELQHPKSGLWAGFRLAPPLRKT